MGRDAENKRDGIDTTKEKFPTTIRHNTCHPPYGKDSSQDEKTVRYEASRVPPSILGRTSHKAMDNFSSFSTYLKDAPH
jgi:hypothetical protein